MLLESVAGLREARCRVVVALPTEGPLVAKLRRARGLAAHARALTARAGSERELRRTERALIGEYMQLMRQVVGKITGAAELVASSSTFDRAALAASDAALAALLGRPR